MSGWAYSSRGFPRFLVPVMLSVPALQVLNLGQLRSGLGLLGLTIAIFAQRRERWLLVGAGLGIASLRISNALPAAVMIGVGLWGRPKAILRTAAGAAIVLLPLCGLAFTGLDTLFCALLVWRDRGRPLNLDRAAGGMASTV